MSDEISSPKKTVVDYVTDEAKRDFIYTRIEKQLLDKVNDLQANRGIKTRSQAIRAILQWAFANGVDRD